MTAQKLSSEKEYMSFVLYKYREIEDKSEQDLLNVLRCSFEDLYKLALCKVPNTTAEDFTDRLRNISEYSHSSLLELNKIIKRVDAIIQISSTENNNAYLMAARDKKKDEKKD